MNERFIKFFAPVNAKTATMLMGMVDRAVNDGCDAVTIWISTTGGSVFHGLSVHHYLKGLPINIRTHNFGSVDSIGVVMYLAGSERHCVPNSRFLLHPICENFHKDQSIEIPRIREILQRMQREQDSIAAIIASEIGKSTDEVGNVIAERTSFTAQEGIEFGLAHDVREQIAEKGVNFDFINEA